MAQVRFAALVGFVALTAVSPAFAGPAMWVVRTAHSEVFLFGSMGVKADTTWQSAKLWKAFNKSTELWVENPQERSNLNAESIKEWTVDASHSLASQLTPSDSARLETAVKRASIPFSALESSKPWFAYVQLEVILEQQARLDPGNLPEKVFAKKAAESGKPIHSEFESLEAQLRFSAALPRAAQIGLVGKALDDLEDGAAALDGRIAAWKAGQLAREISYVEHLRNAHPETFQSIGADRNALWVGRIKEMLSQPGAHFVCMGIDHLVGPDSVVAQLEGAGIRVKRR